MEAIFNAIDKTLKCKGDRCEAVRGTGHSVECEQKHSSEHVNSKPVAESPPSCFVRAEHAGRVFDNCRFFRTCKNVKPICTNHPVLRKKI